MWARCARWTPVSPSVGSGTSVVAFVRRDPWCSKRASARGASGRYQRASRPVSRELLVPRTRRTANVDAGRCCERRGDEREPRVNATRRDQPRAGKKQASNKRKIPENPFCCRLFVSPSGPFRGGIFSKCLQMNESVRLALAEKGQWALGIAGDGG